MKEASYVAFGRKHNFEVYQPEGGSKWLVRKVTAANRKVVGKQPSYSQRDAAVREANRMARADIDKSGRLV